MGWTKTKIKKILIVAILFIIATTIIQAFGITLITNYNFNLAFLTNPAFFGLMGLTFIISYLYDKKFVDHTFWFADILGSVGVGIAFLNVGLGGIDIVSRFAFMLFLFVLTYGTLVFIGDRYD